MDTFGLPRDAMLDDVLYLATYELKTKSQLDTGLATKTETFLATKQNCLKLILWLERIHSDNAIGDVNEKLSNWFNKFYKKFDEITISNLSKVSKFERQLNRLLDNEQMYLSAPMVVAFQEAYYKNVYFA